MPKFTVEHESSHPPAVAYGKIKEFLGKDLDIRKFDAKLDCQFNDPNMTCKMNGSQFKADIAVAAINSGSKVSIAVDLPFLLSPFKSKVQETLQKKLTKYLG